MKSRVSIVIAESQNLVVGDFVYKSSCHDLKSLNWLDSLKASFAKIMSVDKVDRSA